MPAGAVLTGSLVAPADVRIDGTVRGDVESAGAVEVGAPGRVEGAIRARSVRVAGFVAGAVTGGERVELLAGGRVEGDVEAPEVVRPPQAPASGDGSGS